MGVCAIRIDARLIHGQVATLWQGVWNCNRIMVIDSKSANDPMLKSVLKIACPAAVRLSVLEAETAAANLLSGKYGAERITIVTKDPSNLLTLLEKGFRPECDITVGNMSGGNGKVRVNRNIACTPAKWRVSKSWTEWRSNFSPRRCLPRCPVPLCPSWKAH